MSVPSVGRPSRLGAINSSSGRLYAVEKELTNRIKSCSTHSELIDLIFSVTLSGGHGVESFNKHHVSATMTSMARLGARKTLDTADGLQLGKKLLNRAHDIQETLGPRQASSILWSASAIGLRLAPSLIEVLLEKGLPSSSHAHPSPPPNSKDLSMILLSCSSLGYEPSFSWMDRFEDHSLRVLLETSPSSGKFNPLQLSNILYSLASLRHTPGQSWLEAFSSSSRSLLSKLDLAALCGIMWAAGVHQRSITFLWPPNAWVKEAISSSLSHLPAMDCKHISSIMWAVARLQVVPDNVKIKTISSPCKVEERRPSKEWMDSFLNASRQHAPAFDPRSISNLLHALVELNYRPSNEWLDEMLTCLILKNSLSSLPTANLQDVTPLLQSCRALGYFPPPAAMQTLLRVSCQEMSRLDHLMRVGSLSDESLLSHLNALIRVAYNLGKMRLVPMREWLDRFWTITGSCLHRMNLTQLSRLLAAVSLLTMQHHKQHDKATQPPLVPKQWARRAIASLSSLLQDLEGEDLEEGGSSNKGIPDDHGHVVPLGLILQLSWALSSCTCFNSRNISLRTRLLSQAARSVRYVLNSHQGSPLTSKLTRQISQLPTFLAGAGCNRAVDRCQFGKIMFSLCLSHSSQLDSPSISRLLSGLDALGYSPSRAFMVNILSTLNKGGGVAEAAKDPEVLLNLLFSICRLSKKVASSKGQTRSSLIDPAHSSLTKMAVLAAFESGRFRDPETPMRLLLTLSNLGALSGNQNKHQAQSEELWWTRLYAALDTHLEALSLSSLPSLLYFLASFVVASKRQPNRVPQPDHRFVDRIMERVLDSFSDQDAEDVARVLCGLVGLGVGSYWLPRVTLAVEKNSALFSRADHKLIQKAWMKMGRTQSERVDDDEIHAESSHEF